MMGLTGKFGRNSRRLVTLIVATFAFAPAFADAQATKPNADDERAIRAVWETYAKHIDAKAGAKAAALLAKPTVDYYARMRELALTGTQDALGKQGVLMRLSVYLVRHLATAAEIRPLSPRAFIAWSIRRGLVSTMGNRKVELINIKIDGDRAVSAVRVGTSTSPPIFEFHREGGAWRIDVVKAIRVMEPMLETRLKEGNIKEEQILAAMIRRHSKKPYQIEELRKPLADKP